MPKIGKSVALITVHGMGDTPKNYHRIFLERIRKYLGEDAWKKVAFEPLYYQDVLQANENEIYGRMKQYIRWQRIRKFILYGFSDAASLDYRKWLKNSAYHKTQQRIWASLFRIYEACGRVDVPVVILAYSLGCHVLSNYIWDSQQDDPHAGVWLHEDVASLNNNEKRFLRLKSLHRLFTIGCNIPVFVAGYKNILPFKKPHKDFLWENLYDKDDVLGWPLEPLSSSYRKLVTDVPINANENTADLLLKSWNPLSHENYFGDSTVVHSVGDALSEWINQ